MVKKIIGKLLKKEDKEEVPDELPPLVEDEAPKVEAPAEQAPTEAKEGTPEAPKEDPNVAQDFSDLEKKEIKLDTEGLEAETEKPKEEPKEKPEEKSLLLQDLEKELSEPRVDHKTPKEAPPKEAPSKEPEPVHEEVPSTDQGFFSEMLNLTQRQEVDESILNQDLLERMKNFWYFHPQKPKFSNEEKLRQEVANELMSLKRLEERWVAQKKFLEDDKKVLKEREREIRLKEVKLRNILRQLDLFKDVPEDYYFFLNNGICIKNLNDLRKTLDIIDQDTYDHHVSELRNDFSDWVKHALHKHDLAKKMKHSQSREEMSVILENATLGNLYSAGPDKYFVMDNGQVVRDLKELLETLKDMDDAIFSKHLNKEKNDFSSWVRHVYRNDFLADKMMTCHTKEDLIEILENFIEVH